MNKKGEIIHLRIISFILLIDIFTGLRFNPVEHSVKNTGIAFTYNKDFIMKHILLIIVAAFCLAGSALADNNSKYFTPAKDTPAPVKEKTKEEIKAELFESLLVSKVRNHPNSRIQSGYHNRNEPKIASQILDLRNTRMNIGGRLTQEDKQNEPGLWFVIGHMGPNGWESSTSKRYGKLPEDDSMVQFAEGVNNIINKYINNHSFLRNSTAAINFEYIENPLNNSIFKSAKVDPTPAYLALATIDKIKALEGMVFTGERNTNIGEFARDALVFHYKVQLLDKEQG